MRDCWQLPCLAHLYGLASSLAEMSSAFILDLIVVCLNLARILKASLEWKHSDVLIASYRVGPHCASYLTQLKFKYFRTSTLTKTSAYIIQKFIKSSYNTQGFSLQRSFERIEYRTIYVKSSKDRVE